MPSHAIIIELGRPPWRHDLRNCDEVDGKPPVQMAANGLGLHLGLRSAVSSCRGCWPIEGARRASSLAASNMTDWPIGYGRWSGHKQGSRIREGKGKDAQAFRFAGLDPAFPRGLLQGILQGLHNVLGKECAPLSRVHAT